MPEPTVSIVIAAYQAEDSIERCIRSVLAQTEPDLEVIVVDDGSKDRTRAVVDELVERLRDDRLMSAPLDVNGGPSAARNHGLSRAGGTWVGFLDADDEYRPEFAERMLEVASRQPEADVVACAHRLRPYQGAAETRHRGTEAGELTAEAAVRRALECSITHYVWDKLFRRELFGADPFPMGIHRGEDLPVVLTALARSRRVRVVDEALVDYHVDPSSLTWGRVAPVAESERLVHVAREAVSNLPDSEKLDDAFDRLEAIIYLNAAHQAIARLPRDQAVEICRQYGSRIRWGVVAGAVRNPSRAGAALAVFKATPRLYRRVYRRYILRAYALDP